jgi:hypothetical protein
MNQTGKFNWNIPGRKIINRFLIAPLLALACVAGQTSALAIENGATAIGEPVVGIFYEGSQRILCSGAVLEPRIVVTAHHCIPNAGENSDSYLKRKILVSEPGKKITFDVGNKARVIEIVTKKEKWSLGVCANGFCDDLDDIAFLILDRDYSVPANLRIASEEDIQRFRKSNAQVVTYGYGRMSYTEWSPGVPYKLSANLEEPNQGGYGTKAFNVSVKGNQNICSGDSGGPTYALEGDFIYYVGPTSGTRRPSCIEKPMADSGFFGGTFLAAKGSLFTEAQEKVVQIKAAAELESKQEAKNVDTLKECRIPRSDWSIASLGFPLRAERLANFAKPKILVLRFQLKDEPVINMSQEELSTFSSVVQDVKDFSSNLNTPEFIFSKVIEIPWTSSELDQIKINVPKTWGTDFSNSTYGFTEKVIKFADSVIDYRGIDAVILYGKSSSRKQEVAEAMMFTSEPLRTNNAKRADGSNWFDPIKTNEGLISNVSLLYNRSERNVITHELMHLYGLTDLYGGTTGPGVFSLMESNWLNLLTYEKWILGWHPDNQVKCLSNVSTSTLTEFSLEFKKSKEIMLISTTSGANYVVETLAHLGKPTLAFYSVENNRRPPLMLFKDSQSLRFVDLQLATPEKISAQLVAPDVTLLIKDIDSETVTFSLMGKSLTNSEANKVLIDAALVKRTFRIGEIAERDRLLAEVKAAELKAKQEAEAKAAAELKAKQEAEAKAAAELKAKQEAEAKAAAELKAKQEAEAKAAAELKAKQEADAKADADLKAKQEADAKAAAELRTKQEAEAKAAADKAAGEKIIADAKAEAARTLAAAKAAVAKKKVTITCTKGKLTKQVTAVKPVCPKGYKKK